MNAWVGALHCHAYHASFGLRLSEYIKGEKTKKLVTHLRVLLDG
jgi:hypothetical protein